MQYFRHHPKVHYPLLVPRSGTVLDRTITNIFVHSKLRDVVLKTAVIYYPYVVTDNDRPDIVAHKYYGSSDHTWIVFFSNQILDPHFSWPLTYRQFYDYILAKYGDLHTVHQTVHHYEDPDGAIIDAATAHDTPDARTISCFDYEERLNEKKRNIKLISKTFVGQLTTELRAIFR